MADILTWVATFAYYLIPFVPLIFLYFLSRSDNSVDKNHDDGFRFEKLNPEFDLKPYQDEKQYKFFGRPRPSELTQSEKEDILSRSEEILENLEEQDVIGSIDYDLLAAIVENNVDKEVQRCVIEYLKKQNILFEYDYSPILNNVQDYSNLLSKMGKMCEGEFQKVSFEDGVLINGNEEIEISDFLVYIDKRVRSRVTERNFPNKKGSSRMNIPKTVNRFNRILESYGKEKRFYYDADPIANDRVNPYYWGTVWFGTEDQIRSIVKELGLEVELYACRRKYRNYAKIKSTADDE